MLGIIVLLAAFGCAQAINAQDYPIRPVRLIVPFPAGGNADVLARLMAQKMAETWKQNVIVENRVGAAGIIGTEGVAKSPPDGYTLLMGTTGTHTTNPAVYPKLPYDSLKDFAPVSNFADSPFLLISHPSLPVRNLKDVITLAKARPGQLRYSSFGTGSSSHLVGEMLKVAARIDVVHVPYKGGPPALVDLIGGHVELSWNVVPTVAPQARAGKLRALAIASAQRTSALPEVQTFAEAGFKDFEAGSWYGVLAPAGTPKDVLARLHAEIVRILALPDVRQRFAQEGVDPIGNTPQQFTDQIRRELARWVKVAREANVRAE